MKSQFSKLREFLSNHKFRILFLLFLTTLILFIAESKYNSLSNLQTSIQNTTPETIQNILPMPTKEEEKIVLTVNTGEVTVQTMQQDKLLKQSESRNVENGDTITTAKDSIATISYPGGTIVRLAPNTSLTINTNNLVTSLNQTAGTIFVRFKKVLGIQEEVDIDTPTAVATIRGTKIVSKINPTTKESKFITVEHEIEVFKKDPQTNQKQESTKQTLKEGFQAQIGKVGAIKIAKQVLTEEEKKWIELNKDTVDNPSQLLITTEVLNKFLATASPAPKTSASPLASSTPVAPVSYVQGMLGTGYNTGFVKTEAGDYKVSCYGENQGSIRVVTDSANESDCKTDCPVMPLADYATRNNGVAAINGMYFCPADYPACAEKKNSFDTLFFNSRVKRYINSDNNIYSNIPFLVINADGSPRFVGRSSEWGRDTSIQAGTAGNPMLVSGGNLATVEGNLDEKQRTVKSNRGAIVQKSPNLYLCVVSGATVMDAARVFKTLGVDNAINIDGGGSTALWVSGSYKFGPGRNIPTAIIFARK